jgi:hypothetical protein
VKPQSTDAVNFKVFQALASNTNQAPSVQDTFIGFFDSILLLVSAAEAAIYQFTRRLPLFYVADMKLISTDILKLLPILSLKKQIKANEEEKKVINKNRFL